MTTAEKVLIDRGDVPSLAAISLEPDPARLVLVHPVADDPCGRRRRELIRQHAEAFGVADLLFIPPGVEAADPLPPVPEPMELARQLIDAVVIAARLEIGRVIDPRQVGPDAALVGEAVDHVTAATLLSQAGSRGRPIVIDVPLLDLQEAQVADLAEDAAAPMHLCWPCGSGEATPCGECEGCVRWQGAFEEAGLTWPWSAVPVA